MAEQAWKCKAQRTADPPQDCDWPFCGCDHYADKVLAAIAESGYVLVPEGADMPYGGNDHAHHSDQTKRS